MSPSSLIPRVSGRAWAILIGNSLAATGFGVVFPFLIVYLHSVRGMTLGMAGIALGAISVSGLIGAPAVGMLIDRFSARRVLLAGQLFAAAGVISFAFVREPWQALVAALILGVGFAAWWTPELALLATSVPKTQRSSVFALEYTTSNLGFGLGAVLGGVFLSLSRPATFEVGWVICGLPLLAFVAILAAIGERAPYEDTRADRESDAVTVGRGYRAVLSDRVFMRVILFYVVMATVTGSQLDAAFPAYATGPGGVGTRVIGLAFAANTGLIVVTQLFVLRALRGRRRTRALMVTCLAGAICWLVTLLAGHGGGGALAAAGFIVALMVFAIGETTWSPSMPGIVNDLAPPVLRGRYNAMTGIAEGGGRVVGPACAGFALQAGLGDPLLIVLAGANLACLALAFNIERVIPSQANLTGEDVAAAGTTPPV